GVAARNYTEAEIYGLKIAQLLLPINGHRIERWAELKARYHLNPLTNENQNSALGVMGSIGFLFLVGRLLYRKTETIPQAAESGIGLLNHLSVLNASAVLLATIGGLSSLFALLISPQIRGYNRISVYIAFFSFFAVVLLLERFLQQYAQSWRWRAIFCVCLALLLPLGVLDQTTKRPLPDYSATKAQYLHDAVFISKIEASVPPGAMIFQLPVIPFPEAGP